MSIDIVDKLGRHEILVVSSELWRSVCAMLRHKREYKRITVYNHRGQAIQVYFGQ